jgi:RimJ/RimL family protein N-acetyltransferase
MLQNTSDDKILSDILSDERIMQTVSILNGNPVNSIDELNYCKSILCCYQYSNLGVGQYKILSKNKVIGLVGALVGQVENDEIESLEVGYLLKPEVYGKQVATDVLRCLIKFLFSNIISLQNICATTLLTNQASQKVLIKNGFKSLGVRENYRFKSGKEILVFQVNREMVSNSSK